MRINRPSLYAAFGKKEALFRKVVDRYSQGPAGYAEEALKEPTARGVVERFLRGAVEVNTTHPLSPGGCLMVQSALTCGDEAEPIRRELVSRRRTGEATLSARFQRALEEGDLPAGSDPDGLARYVATVVYGMAVEAAGGASRDELLGVVATALRAWPTSKRGGAQNSTPAAPRARRGRRRA